MKQFLIRKEYKDLLKITGYAFILFLIQVNLIACLPYRALRVDLMLPAMVGVALSSSSAIAIVWAFVWGYMVDILTGKFWGLHVGTYVITVRLVQVMAQKVESRNPFYQMFLVLLCVLGQSVILGVFLWIKSPTPLLLDSFLKNLEIRSLLITFLTPLIIFPVLKIR